MEYKGRDAGTYGIQGGRYACRSGAGDDQFFHIHGIQPFLSFLLFYHSLTEKGTGEWL